MSVAWTTLFIIVLLLPGVFFFIGFTAHERYSREIVRSSAASDVGLAVIFALLLHSLAWAFLHHILGFDLAFALKPAERKALKIAAKEVRRAASKP